MRTNGLDRFIPICFSIYLGKGKQGEVKLRIIKREANKRGMAKSPFIMHCIQYTLEHEKKWKKSWH